MFDSLISWLLLPLGGVLGWVLARKAPQGDPLAPSTEQLGGLITQLAGDDPDQAIAALTQVTEMDHSMAELHLTLGTLFRKRGEVDRALRVHEALLARPGLKTELQQQLRFELAQDYVKAGVMDRAETLLRELSAQGRYAAPALELMLGLYERGRDWKSAIDTARLLESQRGESRRPIIAQYWCELAEEAEQQGQKEKALELADRASDVCKECVRAHLMLGRLHAAAESWHAAIKSYRRVLDLDPRFLATVLEPLRLCYQKLGDETGYAEFLHDAKEQSTSSLPLLSEAMVLREQGQDALQHLASSLEQRPSRAILAEFLREMEQRPDVAALGLSKPAASLRESIKKLMDSAPGYVCNHCGFRPRQLFWQCPSCRQWATTVPVDDLLRSEK